MTPRCELACSDRDGRRLARRVANWTLRAVVGSRRRRASLASRAGHRGPGPAADRSVCDRRSGRVPSGNHPDPRMGARYRALRKGLHLSLGRTRLIAMRRLLPPLDPPLLVNSHRRETDTVATVCTRMRGELLVGVLTNLLFNAVFVLLPGGSAHPDRDHKARGRRRRTL
jgi:hypothetical protein